MVKFKRAIEVNGSVPFKITVEIPVPIWKSSANLKVPNDPT